MAHPVSGPVAWIVRLHPLWALVIVTGGFLLLFIVNDVLLFGAATGEPSQMEHSWPRPAVIASAAFGSILMALLVSWPAAISLYLNRSHGEVTCVSPRFVGVCFFVALAALFSIAPSVYISAELSPIFLLSPHQSPVVKTLYLTWHLFVMFCIFYLFWSGARALVFAEEGRRVGKDRRIGTFLQLYFLPLGIYFVQRRLHRLLQEGQVVP